MYGRGRVWFCGRERNTDDNQSEKESYRKTRDCTQMSNRTYLRVEKPLKDVGYVFGRFVRIVAVWRIVDGESFGVSTRVEREADKVVVHLLHELVGK
jgi:hypothetical protein